jgi:hypothetical protein
MGVTQSRTDAWQKRGQIDPEVGKTKEITQATLFPASHA